MKLLADINLPGGLGTIETNMLTSRFTDLNSIATFARDWLLGIAGILAVAAVIYSGFMYLTAAGNPEQAEKAKKNLTWSIIGVVLVILAIFIVAVVQNIFLNNPV